MKVRQTLAGPVKVPYFIQRADPKAPIGTDSQAANRITARDRISAPTFAVEGEHRIAAEIPYTAFILDRHPAFHARTRIPRGEIVDDRATLFRPRGNCRHQRNGDQA